MEHVGEAHKDSAINRRAILLGLLWLLAAFAWIISLVPDSLRLTDGLLIARVQVFGGALCAASGFLVLPSFWRASMSTHRGIVYLAISIARTLTAVAVFLGCVAILALAVNARDLVKKAFGYDRLFGGQVLLADESNVEIRGPLSSGIAHDLVVTLGANPSITRVTLNSVGGWIQEGNLLARVIREHGLATHSATGCYSACVMAYLAGVRRTLSPEARLGFHGASGDGTDPLYLDQMTTSMGDDLRDAGASESFVKRALSTPSQSMWFPMPHELLREGLVNQFTSDGMPPTGEPLLEFDGEIEKLLHSFPFLATLRRSDSARFEQFDRQARLRYRRSATDFEHDRAIVILANEIEVELVPIVSTQAASQYLAALQSVASALEPSSPAQCVAVIGFDLSSIESRTAVTVKSLSPALSALIDAPREAADARAQLDTALMERFILRAAEQDPLQFNLLINPNAGSLRDNCDAQLWFLNKVIDLASNETAEIARALRMHK
ncbi:MAG: hypothetical protein U0900_15050 [Myxococcota bacterium]